MKKVLFILGDFWPTNSGGTIRIAKLVKYLPSHGWEGLILTRRLKGNAKEEVIKGTKIFRTEAADLGLWFQKVKSVFKKPKKQAPSITKNNEAKVNSGRLAEKLFVPDINILWALGSVFSLRSIVKKQKIDCIYSSSPLSSSHIIPLVYDIFFKRDIKWVVEFRDPWTFNPFRDRKPSLLEKFDHYLEKLVIVRCDTIIVTSMEYKNMFLEKYKFLTSSKINYIPNGYDPEDFLGLEKKRTTNKVKIVHTGNFYEKRSLQPFLKAFYQLIEKHPEYKDNVIFEQYGVVDAMGIEFNEAYENTVINLKATVPHRESLQETCNADWLLLVPGPGAGTMPGKLYEYLATGNPIIGLINEGPAKKLIETLRVGYVIGTTDIEAIKETLIEIIEGQARYSAYSPLSNEIIKFDRKNIAHQVSTFLS